MHEKGWITSDILDIMKKRKKEGSLKEIYKNKKYIKI